MNERLIKQEQILEIVCSHFEVNKYSVKGKSRVSNVRNARHVVIYFLREHLHMGLKEIGDYMGRDHTTVIHALRNIQNYISTKDWISDDIAKLRGMLLHCDLVKHNRVLFELDEKVDVNGFITDVTNNYNVKYTMI